MIDNKVCSLEGCSDKHKAKTYCEKHYVKFRKFGDPKHGKENERHGGDNTPEYRAFKAMKNRCNNPNFAQFCDYGGRGIEMRFKTFNEFLGDVGIRPSEQHSLDRVDSNGHYEKGNVRWVTRYVQNKNRRDLSNRHLPGVSKHGEYYQARVSQDGKRYSIGYYKSKEEAHAAFKGANVLLSKINSRT